MKSITLLSLAVLLLISMGLSGQQIPDTSQFFDISTPRYKQGKGPVVYIDGGHQNFHTLDGRYRAFGNILEADGYRVKSQSKPIDRSTLKGCDIYVISNALHPSNENAWVLPNPSAFTKEEIEAMEKWVRNGGSLFLIADHMPCAGAATELARAFHFEFLNCFAMDLRKRAAALFTKATGSLGASVITAHVDSIVSFTGSAFAIPGNATSILRLDDEFRVMMPKVAWEFNDSTPSLPGDGLHQLAHRKHGKGRIVVSGEAAMFSAQLAGPQRRPMGLNNPIAKNNIHLLRAIMDWLAE